MAECIRRFIANPWLSVAKTWRRLRRHLGGAVRGLRDDLHQARAAAEQYFV